MQKQYISMKYLPEMNEKNKNRCIYQEKGIGLKSKSLLLSLILRKPKLLFNQRVMGQAMTLFS